MPRSASGNYVRPSNSFSNPVTATVISSTDADALFDDFETALDGSAVKTPAFLIATATAAGGIGNRRLLAAGAGLTATDGGPESSLTIAVGAGTGITVNADDVQLAAIDSGKILGNPGASSAAPVGTSLSALIDAGISSANVRGTILYRGASAWTALPPATANNVLQTGGAGADPSWVGLAGGGDMLAANNLSDVANKATSAINLGLGNELINFALDATASAGALTVSVKGANGNDPSSANPVTIGFRNVTGTIGTYSSITLYAATSLVISSGSTLGVVSSAACRLWVVGFNDGGVFRLGVVNCASTTTVIYPLNDGLASSTAEGGAGAADSAGVIYTGTAISSKAMRILGFIEWSATGMTAGTWTTAALLLVQLFGPGIPTPGKVVQTSSILTDTQTSTTSSTPQATSLSLSMAQKSAANRVRFIAAGNAYVANPATTAAQLRVYRDAVAIGSYAHMQVTTHSVATMIGMNFPNDTAAATFQVRIASADNTTSVTWGIGASFPTMLIVDEIMA